MRLDPNLTRVRYVMASRGRQLAGVLLLVGLLALGTAAVSYANPPTMVVTEDRHSQTIETSLHTSATVTGNSSLYERGQRLEDMPLYLVAAAPDLTLTLRTDGPADHSVQVHHQLRLVYTAERDGKVFWTRSRPLIDEQGTGATPAQTTIDVRSVRAEAARLNSELGGAGTVNVYLRMAVTYDTGRYEGEMADEAPLRFSDTAYWVAGDIETQRTHATPTEVVRVDPAKMTSVDLPGVAPFAFPTSAGMFGGIGVLSLIGAALVGHASRREINTSELATQLHEQRYAEWISEGELPRTMDRQAIAVHSLEDLVDIGIDQSQRPIHDPNRELYALLDGDVVYYYGPTELDSTCPFDPGIPTEGQGDPLIQEDGGLSFPGDSE